MLRVTWLYEQKNTCSGADKSYSCSLSDKSTKFGMEILYLILFQDGYHEKIHLCGQNHNINSDEAIKLHSVYNTCR